MPKSEQAPMIETMGAGELIGRMRGRKGGLVSLGRDRGRLKLRKPEVEDGAGISALVDSSKPLDPNSTYCYLLLCRDFAETCVVAEDMAGVGMADEAGRTGGRGEIVGFLSGYRPPDRGDVLFVWQVAVDADTRNGGLAKRMLHEVLKRPSVRGCRFLETTISPSNEPSKRLFTSLARELQARCEVSACFSESHFGSSDGGEDRKTDRGADRGADQLGDHEAEYLFRIGPFDLERMR
ncbi:diaminobutyrate acetyltransferase [Candidatus Methanocrinis natronophilus]|uniref:L-2,4-diaminobutyric acid acetyltransferase n=1 Tax=Candidatus Methanocrinis natronophilus TaxID=3033396 RepID=A0ABT5X7H1_9EURY|nr:diaminobutyrate acetyltransferase [Candidatus Methanocrinis natronophilus]MDF0590642.1 diaminobutyrate acetyltransferase [Candidatus Methanocrinis natronophilus]